ncbi:MAG TPA: patatin-like phospholipase family protein [Anaerolineaceae bacterium]|nr:patatin-like phospholipase family protein [Anaerolineaceae bacterium]
MAKEIVLALGGGGMRGIAHLGVLRCLQDNGYTVKGIAGTSIGALIGALYASGATLQEVDSVVDHFASKPNFDRKPGDGPAFLGNAFIEQLLSDFFQDRLIEDFPIKFAATATNLDTEREIVLSSGRAIDVVLTAIAIPGIFPCRQTEEGLIIDGGVLDPIPVGVARQLDPALPVVAVCLYKKNHHEANYETTLPFESLLPKPLTQRFARNRYYEALSILTRSVDLMLDHMADATLLIDKPDVLVTPLVGHYRLLDYEIPTDLRKRGYDAMEGQLGELEKSLDFVKTLIRVAKYTDHSDELEPTINPLPASQEGD